MTATRFALALIAASQLSGCGTLPSGKGWGEDVTIAPGWERVRESAVNAARDPWVWGPLIGAAAFQIDDFDRRASDWAREHTPIFGAEEDAEDWSDHLKSASTAAYFASVAFTPSGDEPVEWLINKTKGVLVGGAAIATTGILTNELKHAADRERPNGEDGLSFPSGHTSASAVDTRLASRNLESIPMSDVARTAANVGLYGLTIGTSWARIEAGYHYPSDTLFSMALGNFLASFFNDAFMGVDGEAPVALTSTGDGAVLQWRVRF